MADNIMASIDVLEEASARIAFIGDAVAALSHEFDGYDFCGAVLCLSDARREIDRAAGMLKGERRRKSVPSWVAKHADADDYQGNGTEV